MVSEYMYDISKIVEGAIDGNLEMVVSYCEQLQNRLRDDGEDQSAEILQQSMSQGKSSTMMLTRTSSNGECNSTIPLDEDSSNPIADEENFSSVVDVFLPGPIRKTVDEFVSFYNSADRLVANGISLSASMLLYGPPGCGKTELARHIASKVNLPLITARTDSLISSYLGSTAKNIRSLFEYTASRPCVLFLDEFDALGKMRDDQHELGELKRVVISLLQNIDSLGRNNVLLAATNHEHLLDPAIWRRFAYSAKLNLPTEENRRKILSRFLDKWSNPPLIDAIAAISEGLSGSQLRDISEISIRRAIIAELPQVDRKDSINQTIQVLSNGHDIDESSMSEQIVFLRNLSSKRFTQDRLSEIFDVSQSQISKILRKGIKK